MTGTTDGAAFAVVYPDAGEACIVSRKRSSGRLGKRERDPLAGERRAVRKIRRYALANKLNRLVTVTFATPERDRDRTKTLVKRVLKKVRARLGCAFPYVRVIATHPGGHGLHIHFLMSAHAAELFQASWAHGHVNIKRLRGKRAVRKAAHYLSHDFDTDVGGHRYDVAQGFPVRRLLSRSSFPWNLYQFVNSLMGRDPDQERDYGPVWVGWWDLE